MMIMTATACTNKTQSRWAAVMSNRLMGVVCIIALFACSSADDTASDGSASLGAESSAQNVEATAHNASADSTDSPSAAVADSSNQAPEASSTESAAAIELGAVGTTFNLYHAIDLASTKMPDVDEFNIFEVEDGYAADDQFGERADELAGLMYKAKLTGEPLAIVGSDTVLTQSLTTQALSSWAAGDLDTLVVVYVGAPDQQTMVEALFENSGATIRFIAYTVETI